MWPDTDAFLSRLPQMGGEWYLFDTDATVPGRVATAGEIAAALAEFTTLLDEIRNRTACGAIYVDDRDAPSFIKLFDPFAMGTSCGGSSSGPTLPRWILSRMKPDPIPEDEAQTGPGFWARLAGRHG